MPEIQLSEFYVEFLGFVITLIVALSVRDWATSFVKGMKFKLNRAFNEGDKVILDGCPALIVRIGTSETVFGVYNKDGYTWRYVPNEKIENLKIEKIIFDHLPINNQIQIRDNKEQIQELKNG